MCLINIPRCVFSVCICATGKEGIKRLRLRLIRPLGVELSEMGKVFVPRLCPEATELPASKAQGLVQMPAVTTRD